MAGEPAKFVVSHSHADNCFPFISGRGASNKALHENVVWLRENTRFALDGPKSPNNSGCPLLLQAR